jgi:DNA-binding NarL/FixJ family response regulator
MEVSMPVQEPRILAAGIERVAFERLAPELRRDTLEVDWAATPEAGVALAVRKRYDVIIMDAEPCDWPLTKVVHEFRSADSPSRDAAIMILARPDEVDAARALKSHGVNRVMLVSDPPKMIRKQMSTLLAVAPRVAVRLPTNLETALGNTGRELFCQTENLSTSGMFVKTRHRPQLGSTVVFRIYLSGDSGTVFGRGNMVRHSSPTEEKLDGVAIRFLSFASDGAQRLQDYLENLTNELEPEPESLQSHSSQPEKGPCCKPEDKVILEFE